jgi:hypothetical protein
MLSPSKTSAIHIYGHVTHPPNEGTTHPKDIIPPILSQESSTSLINKESMHSHQSSRKSQAAHSTKPVLHPYTTVILSSSLQLDNSVPHPHTIVILSSSLQLDNSVLCLDIISDNGFLDF